jgi:hypothetical protein
MCAGVDMPYIHICKLRFVISGLSLTRGLESQTRHFCTIEVALQSDSFNATHPVTRYKTHTVMSLTSPIHVCTHAYYYIQSVKFRMIKVNTQYIKV